MATIRKRQTQFISQIIRREVLDNIVILGKICVRRGRGRSTEMMLDGQRLWNGWIYSIELTQIARDQNLWKDMNIAIGKAHDDDVSGHVTLSVPKMCDV